MGIPRKVLTDRGTEFTGEVMHEIQQLPAIKEITTTPYHAHCNRLVERFNATLKPCSGNSVESNQEIGTDISWQYCLPTERCPRRAQDFSCLSFCMGGQLGDPWQCCKICGQKRSDVRRRSLPVSATSISQIRLRIHVELHRQHSRRKALAKRLTLTRRLG